MVSKQYFLRNTKIHGITGELTTQHYDPKVFGKVAVLYGGDSAERDVSLESGKQVHKALLSKGIDSVLIDTAHDCVPQLLNAKVDRAFIALHGGKGEDGSIQATLTYLDIPFTGTGVSGSAFAMDKLRSKLIWNSLKLPTPVFGVASDVEDLKEISKTLGSYPLCVKPINEGSSIGVSRATDFDSLVTAFHLAKQYNSEVLIERWFDGHDFTVAIVNQMALPPIKIIPTAEFYSYDAKYKGGTQYLCPAPISETEQIQLCELALTAFNSLHCHGWGRVDFIQDAQGKFWLLEVNTVPGFTATSLVPKAAKAAGVEFPDLVQMLLAQTLQTTVIKKHPQVRAIGE
jgi:D-alanine-D-alanine ligase